MLAIPVTNGSGSKHKRTLSALVGFLFLSAVYLFAFPQTNLAYGAVVMLHILAGILASVLLFVYVIQLWRTGRLLAQAEWLILTIGAVLGIYLIFKGTRQADWNWAYAHIVFSLIAVSVLVARRWSTRRGYALSWAALAISFVSLALLSVSAYYVRHSRWEQSARIVNPKMPPAEMGGEGDGPSGPFFPSSAQVKSGEKIPSKFFMESDSCQRCHQDIYKQWSSSAHHFSSFNNQWYRKSIEYMQDVVGTKPSKWCGGCHDPAVLYSGKMDTPIKQIVHTPEAQAGLGCMMCHSIAQVKSTMGQGDFYLEYPKLHELAASKNPVMQWIHDFMVRVNPEPHRRVFLKPFMRNQTAEFCSSCHKVHLDVPVNSYRWLRGFNEYDNWQASGISGQGARSFYYPDKPKMCADCHMPMEKSHDDGNMNGMVHSHRFPGANTAVPTANEDHEQLELTEAFLKNKALTIDIFAVSPAAEEKRSAGGQSAEVATSFAVGEEAETKITPASTEAAAPVTAPLDRVQPTLRRGDTVRIDVVVRTKNVGHFFPGGTVDAYDTWVELKGVDENGQTVFWSGMVEDDGKGPVEKGAHFYRSLQIDEHGNPINKRNAWSTRATVYVRLIPPGAADTIHYRMKIPEKMGSKLRLTARLCYRKFAWWNTQFAFAGIPDLTKKGGFAPGFDDRPMVFTGSLQGVSAKKEAIPNVPIVTIATNEVTLPVGDAKTPPLSGKVVLDAKEWQRWNDYGIGLFLQGDLKAAQAAFRRITEMDPNNPDGWVNVGRVAVQEGDMETARTVLQKALQLTPDLARARFFYAKVLRADGDYDGTVEQLRKVIAQYPRDRVALNDLGRVLFLQKKYREAIDQVQNVLDVDPEDLQAHYTLMLCYRGLGDTKLAQEHELRYRRFKADEASQAITGRYRQLNAEDNNERQSIHEHVSVPLTAIAQKDAKASYAAAGAYK